MLAPIVECGEASGPGADYFVRKYTGALLGQDPDIDTLVLGCTHYPLLLPKFREVVPESVQIVSQGEIVADSLADYLKRHPEMESRLRRGGECKYLTTEDPTKFTDLARIFLNESVDVEHGDF